MTIQTAYNIRDNIFILSDQGIKNESIKSISINIYKKGDNAGDMNKEYTTLYSITGFRDSQHENKLFKSKEELIASL